MKNPKISDTPPLTRPFELVDMAWQRYITHVPLFTKIVLPPTLFYIFIDCITFIAKNGNTANPVVLFSKIIEQNVIFAFLFSLFAIILQTLATAALLVVITENKTLSVTEAYQKGRTKLLSFWWISLLTALIAGGGFLLFIIPGIMLSVWFTFSQFVFFSEGKKGMQALLTSREYVRGQFWQVAFRVLFITIIIGALSSIAGYSTVLFQNQFLSQVSQSIISLITIPLALLYQHELFIGLRKLHGEVVNTIKPWWLYVIGLLIPVLLIALLSIALSFVKPVKITRSHLATEFKTGEYILMGQFPDLLTLASTAVISEDAGKYAVWQVLAGPKDTLTKEKDTVVINAEDSNAFHHGSYTLSNLKPTFSMKDGEKKIVPQDTYILFSGGISGKEGNWKQVKNDQISGVPLFCFWNCTK